MFTSVKPLKMSDWKKIENERGFLYYINHQSGLKQWDHPKFSDIKQGIDECNYVTYPTYRLALKFRILQRALFMEDVSLATICSIFDKHKLGNNENTLNLETCDLETVLADIFFMSNKKNHTNIDIDYTSELGLNLLYNIFDRFREGNIQVFSTKILVGMLSSCTLTEFYKYLFNISSDHNNCITRMRLKALLMKIFQLIKYLHEDVTFGLQEVNQAIESCFQNSPGLVGITESSFISWLDTQPRFLAWIPQIFKLKFAETVMHAVKCATCKTKPIMGLKYTCLKCSKYNQCQRCFLTGRISHSHKLTHSVKEFFKEPVYNKSTDFIEKLCGLFCLRPSNNYFCIIKPTSYLMKEIMKPYQSTLSIDIQPLSSPQVQLQGVIRQLEYQNRELQQLLIFGNCNDKELKKYLDEYGIFMAENIKKLKILKNHINKLPVKVSSEVVVRAPTRSECGTIHSTPMVQYIDKPNQISIRNMSPITMLTDLDEEPKLDVVDGIPGNALNLQTLDAKPIDPHNIWRIDKSYPDSVKSIDNHVKTLQTNNVIDKSEATATRSPVKLLHNDLDEALAKLQQILANNFSLEDSLSPMDNCNLKYAVTEVEGMLTSIIDNVESSRCSSAMPGRTKS